MKHIWEADESFKCRKALPLPVNTCSSSLRVWRQTFYLRPAKLSALLRHPAGMWEVVRSFYYCSSFWHRLRPRRVTRWIKKTSVWVQCSLTAGELQLSIRPSHLPSVTRFNDWLLNCRELSYSLKSYIKLRSESHTVSETQKVLCVTLTLPPCCFILSHSKAVESCCIMITAVHNKLSAVYSQQTLRTSGFISSALILGCFSPRAPVIETFFIRGEGVHPVIDIFTRGESVH